jgi:hypothetical protein
VKLNVTLTVLAAAVLIAVSYAYSLRVGAELLARAEIDALERIPVLGEQ